MRKTINSQNIAASGPYSHAVDAGDYIFLSGQTAMNAAGLTETEHLKGDITTQTKQCFTHLYDVLTEIGLDESHIVKVNVYLTTMEHFTEMNDVYKRYFQSNYPARTCIAVYELPLGAEVEIECIAKR